MANQSYIKHVKLSGYRSIKNLEADFLPGLNIIIGDNGSGKSNFFKFIDSSFKQDFYDFNIFSSKIEYKYNNKNKELKFSTIPYTENKLGKTRITLGNRAIYKDFTPEVENIIEIVPFALPLKLYLLGEELNILYQKKGVYANFVNSDRNFPLRFQEAFCQILPTKLQKLNTYTDSVVFDDVNNFIFKHYSHFLESITHYTEIKEIKLANGLRVTSGTNEMLEIRNIVFEYLIDGIWLSWDSLSDGTRRLIYTFFLVCGFQIEDKPAPIIFIEEPEIGIHPHQLHLLLQFLKERSEVQQIFISTHSPQVLDILGVDDLNKITIAEIQPKVGTQFRKLNNSEVSKAKKYLSKTGFLSDYWRFSDFQRTKKY